MPFLCRRPMPPLRLFGMVVDFLEARTVHAENGNAQISACCPCALCHELDDFGLATCPPQSCNVTSSLAHGMQIFEPVRLIVVTLYEISVGHFEIFFTIPKFCHCVENCHPRVQALHATNIQPQRARQRKI